MTTHAAPTRNRTGLLGLALTVGLALAPAANAFTISEADLPDAGLTVDLGFARVDAVGGVFDRKAGGTVTGTGIAVGYVGGEIDGSGESIVFTFSEASVITSLDLTYLFQSPNHEDAANEAARIRARSGDTVLEGILQVADSTSATWSFVGGGAVTTISVPTMAGEGWFSVANPFGDLGIDSLEPPPRERQRAGRLPERGLRVRRPLRPVCPGAGHCPPRGRRPRGPRCPGPEADLRLRLEARSAAVAGRVASLPPS